MRVVLHHVHLGRAYPLRQLPAVLQHHEGVLPAAPHARPRFEVVQVVVRRGGRVVPVHVGLVAAKIEILDRDVTSRAQHLRPVHHVAHRRSARVVRRVHRQAGRVGVRRVVAAHDLEEGLAQVGLHRARQRRQPLEDRVVAAELGLHVPHEHLQPAEVLEGGGHARHVGGGGEREKIPDLAIKTRVGARRRDQHHRALRVADVIELVLPGGFQHEVDGGGNVVLGHLVEAELPEPLVVGAQRSVAAGVLVAPDVAQPHVEAGVVQQVGQADVPAVEQPALGGGDEAVHHQHGFSPASNQSLDFEDVAVGRCDVIPLRRYPFENVLI